MKGFLHMKGHDYLQRGDKSENSLTTFYIFSRTTTLISAKPLGRFQFNRPIAIKPGIKHDWVKEIHVCSNEGTYPFQRENDTEKAKTHVH